MSTTDDAAILTDVQELVCLVAAELASARPQTDAGLLPTNSLLLRLESLLAEPGSASCLLPAAAAARSWIDDAFTTTVTFEESHLRLLRSWVEWMDQALSELACSRSIPALPAEWSATATATPTIPLPAVAIPPAIPDPMPAAVPGAPETPLVLSLESDRELLREFVNESTEHLNHIEQGLLVLEERPTDADTVNTIFRAFHTFKGGAGFLKLHPIQTLAHELESLLDHVRRGALSITPAIVDLILQGGDTLRQFVAGIDQRLAGQALGDLVVPTLDLLTRVRGALDPHSDMLAPAPQRGPSVSEIAPVPAGAAPPRPLAAPVGGSAPAPSLPASSSAVKVDIGKLDAVVDLVGELVIGQSMLFQNPSLAALPDEQLMRTVAHLGRITKELQRTAMSLRMVPIRASFQKMARLVRDTASRLGKDVELIMEGEDTELDRTIVEEIGDPLIHMIRNAIDHGIELPAVRSQRGKPARGTITLRAFHQGGSIVIEISDNGNGLDKTRLLAKAVEKGIVRPEASLSENEIFNLIFAPGFSTAEVVTDLSGRGVGMDVVRRNIEKLRGKIEIHSTPGAGSSFSIHLPLTLAIIDGLLVGLGSQRYVLPTLSVREAFRCTPDMLVPLQGLGEAVSVRGRLLPVLRLQQFLALTEPNTATEWIAIVIETGKRVRCVLVDRLLGKQEVVVKRLAETCNHGRLLAGAAILGDGRVGLILDPVTLVELQPAALESAA